MKRIIGVLFAVVLVIGGLGSFAYAQEPVNKIWASFATHWEYNPPGDTFTNTDSPVTGYKNWHADLNNGSDATGQEVTGLGLSLASGLAFDQVSPPATIGPSTYQWSFGNVPEGPDVNVSVGSKSPDKFPVTFTPGFDVSRSISPSVFTAPGEQTLTITLTPRDKTEGLSIHVRTKEEAWVNPVITSPTTDEAAGIRLSSDGRFLMVNPKGLLLNTTWTITVTIQVTPNVAKVEYMPFIIVWEEEKLAYGRGECSRQL